MNNLLYQVKITFINETNISKNAIPGNSPGTTAQIWQENVPGKTKTNDSKIPWDG